MTKIELVREETSETVRVGLGLTLRTTDGRRIRGDVTHADYGRKAELSDGTSGILRREWRDPVGYAYWLEICADVGLNGTYVVQQQTAHQWVSIEEAEFDTLEEAKAAVTDLHQICGWTGLRVVLENGPRYNLSGKLLTGDDALEVVFVQDAPDDEPSNI